MRPEDRSALHEVMEQQSASVSRGGITATLNARCSVIAIANPVYGRYDPFRNLTENIPSIPIPLLTRFDMIFVIRDAPSKKKDTAIAQHIMAIRKKGSVGGISSGMDADTFAKYLIIAKGMHPKLSGEAEQRILEYYIKMRNADDGESGITITPRQLEGLIRLTTARARMLLKTEADGSDAARAIHILEEMFESSGVDVNTGKVDLGVLEGKPKSEAGKMQLFLDIMRSLSGSSMGATRREITSEMEKTAKWDESAALEFFQKAVRDNLVYEPSPGRYRSVS